MNRKRERGKKEREKGRRKILPCAQPGGVETESRMTVHLWGGGGWVGGLASTVGGKVDDDKDNDDFCNVFSLALYTFHCEPVILPIVSTYGAINSDWSILIGS